METVERQWAPVDLQRAREHGGERVLAVDVRSPGEFAARHVPGAVNIPMEQIEARMDDLDPGASLVLVCHSGQRAELCQTWLQARGRDCVTLRGGTRAWAEVGLPLVRTAAARWPLERQVRLAAGLLVLLGAGLAVTVDARWFGLSAFVGAGLTFAGLTGLCPMGNLLARMPWNGARPVRPR
jgi:rhodanese-related sulfurtransferase